MFLRSKLVENKAKAKTPELLSQKVLKTLNAKIVQTNPEAYLDYTD